jgi:CHASE3 domain sensor protein
MNSNRYSRTSAFKSRTESWTTVGLLAALLFFLVSGTIAYINIRVLRDDNQQIVHSHAAITSLDDLLATVLDAETGQRGFLMTANERYLEPYNNALTRVAGRLDAIASLTRDNAAQQAGMAPLRRHIGAKLVELAETIDLQRTKGHEAALAVVMSDRGKMEMDAIRAQIGAMQGEEVRLREIRLTEMATAYRTAWASGILSAALGMALTLVIGFLVRRASSARERQQWLQAGKVGLAGAMLGDLSTEDVGDRVLAFLANYLGAQAGAIFAGDGAQYQRAALLGVPGDVKIADSFSLKEGLLGRVAAAGSPTIITDVPEGYLTIGSALGRDKPRHLVIAPLTADDIVSGVIELGFFIRYRHP